MTDSELPTPTGGISRRMFLSSAGAALGVGAVIGCGRRPSV
ncbi:MAG: hypothetical protein WDN07_02775 [Actinomycetota bacterium]